MARCRMYLSAIRLAHPLNRYPPLKRPLRLPPALIQLSHPLPTAANLVQLVAQLAVQLVVQLAAHLAAHLLVLIQSLAEQPLLGQMLTPLAEHGLLARLNRRLRGQGFQRFGRPSLSVSFE